MNLLKGLLGSKELNATESEAWFRTLLESAPDAMVIADAEGVIATVNDQAVQMFGYTQEELLGQKIEMLLPERIRQRHLGHRDQYAANPELRPMGTGLELLGQRKDGLVA